MCDSENINSVGKVVKDVKLKIMKDNKECNTGGIGEIYVSAPYFSKTYLNNNDTTTYENGWIKTKDLAYVNSNGCIVFVGRKNFIFKINGEFINPIEIEKHILQYPGIKNCIVKTTNVENSIPKLSVDLLCEKDINISDLRIYLNTKLEPNEIPKIFNIVDDISTTWNGKKLRTVANVV